MTTLLPKGNVRQGDGKGGGRGFRGGKGTPGYPVPPEALSVHDTVPRDDSEADPLGLDEIIVGVTKQSLGLGDREETPVGVVQKADPLDVLVKRVVSDLIKPKDNGHGPDLGFGFNEDGYPIQDKYEFQQMPIAVENKKGTVRKFYDPNGKEKGSVLMGADYGYVEDAIGADGEPVDVYVGDDESAQWVYVVHQNKAPDFKEYDEDKVMLGFPTEEEAKQAYLRQYNDPRFYGGMSSMPVGKFREKLKKGGKITNELKKLGALQSKRVVESTPMDNKPSPKSIAHLEDLPPERFLAFLGKLVDTPGEIEVTEKVDGSAKITFVRHGPEVWAKSKNGPVRKLAEDWPEETMFDALREAHRALQRGAGKLPDGKEMSGDVLYTTVPNTVEYGPNAVVVHSDKVKKVDLGRGWTLESAPIVKSESGDEIKREFASFKELYERLKGLGKSKASAETLKNAQKAVKQKLLPMLKRDSQFGPKGGGIEGLVLKDLKTGEMAKLVDRDSFTKLNKFLWKFRELLDRGAKVGDEWKSGVKSNFKAALADAVGMPGLRAPNAAERVREAGGIAAYVKKHTDADGKPIEKAFKFAVDKMGEELKRLREEWEVEKHEPAYHELHVQRTDQAFEKAEKTHAEMERMAERLKGKDLLYQAVAVALIILGPQAVEKLGEGKKLDEVANPQDFRRLAQHWEDRLSKKGIELTGKILGDGTYGVALECTFRGKPAVLKVSQDESEAKSMNHIKGKKLKKVVNVYDVFQFPDEGPGGFKPLYATLEEKLTRPNSADLDDWKDLIEMMEAAKAGYMAIAGRFDMVSKAVDALGSPGISERFRELAEYFGYKEMIEELHEHNIQFLDYNTGNIMMRGDDFVLIDLGMSRSPGGAPPQLESKIIEMVSEGRADKVAVTIGRYQPFHKGHAELIRSLTQKFNRVLVLVAGSGKDKKKNPFSYDLRLDMMKESLPDCFSKIEIHKAEIDGKPNGYIPGILSSISVNKHSTVDMETAVTVVVGEDRKADVEEQFRRAVEHAKTEKLYFDPTLATVQTFPAVQGDDGRISGTQVRDAVLKGDEEAVKKAMDPHLVSNPEKFKRVYDDMRRELGAKEPARVESIVRESLKTAGGADSVMRVLTKYEDELKNRRVHPIDIQKLKALGQGSDGIAYDMGGNQVFKLTTDTGEAISSYKVMKKGGGLKHVVKIYDVFHFNDSAPARGDIYGIIQEKLKEMSDQEKEDFDACTEWLVGPPRGRDDVTGKERGGMQAAANGDIPPEVNEKIQPYIRKGDWNGAMEALGEVLKTTIANKMGGTKEDPARDKWALSLAQKQFLKLKEQFDRFQLEQIVNDLKSIEVEFSDYHSGNLMKRGNAYVITDLGRSATRGGEEPPMLKASGIKPSGNKGVVGQGNHNYVDSRFESVVREVVNEVSVGAFTGMGYHPGKQVSDKIGKGDPDERWETKTGLPKTRPIGDKNAEQENDPDGVKNAGINEANVTTLAQMNRVPVAFAEFVNEFDRQNADVLLHLFTHALREYVLYNSEGEFGDEKVKASDPRMMPWWKGGWGHIERVAKRFSAFLKKYPAQKAHFKSLNSTIGVHDIEQELNKVEDEVKNQTSAKKMAQISSDVFMKFPDGSSWTKLNSTDWDDVAQLMQHCGRPAQQGSDLYQLFDKNNVPHVTVELNTEDPEYHSANQIKGKQNRFPEKKYWSAVIELLTKMTAHDNEDLSPEEFKKELRAKYRELWKAKREKEGKPLTVDEMIRESAKELAAAARYAKRVLEVLPVDEAADRRVAKVLARQPKGRSKPIKKSKK